MKQRHRWGSWGLVCAMLLAPTAGFGAVRVDSETIVRVFERDTPTTEGARVIPVYEYLDFEANPAAVPALSAHFYGWGRYAAGDEYFKSDTAGEVVHAFLRYRAPGGLFTADAGRLSVSGGLAQDSVDGLSLFAEPLPGLTMLAYGGLPVALSETSGISGDSLLGGHVAYRAAQWATVGASYRQLKNDGDTASTLAGADVLLSPDPRFDLQGFSSYNLESDEWAELSGRATLRLGFFRLSPHYRVAEYEGFFDKGAETASPFRLLGDTPERLTVYGGDVGLYPTDAFTLEAFARRYDHRESGETANYYGALAEGRPFAPLLVGLEGARMDGETTENRYDLGRVYFRAGSDKTFVSGEGIYVRYDESILGEDASLFASLGVGVAAGVEGLTLNLSGDYSKDPYFDRDVRGMLTVRYRFAN